MFRSLGQLFQASGRTTNDVFLVHPLQLGRWLDEAWATAGVIPVLGTGSGTPPFPFLGSDTIVTDLDLPQPTVITVPPPVPSGLQTTDPDVFNGSVFTAGSTGLVWDHLIYAYLVESTGVFEIMAEVVRRLVVGETMNPLSREGLRWSRATEELFFRDPPLFSIGGVVSQLRPDMRINRRNSYWRMFGMDTPHPIPPRWASQPATDAPWKADVGGGVNAGFRDKWNELLRQIWLGIENRANGIGPNATDSEYVAFLCKAIKDMLNMRRIGGQLAREEFVNVTTMSWFHLTLETDSPIVQDLRCEGTHPADRLARIAQRVGMTAAPRARELFDLAELMSALLRAIELGFFDTGAAAETLFIPISGNAKLREDVNRIIDLWQSATGERVKDRPSVPAGGRPAPAQPLRLPNPMATAPASDPVAASANGQPR